MKNFANVLDQTILKAYIKASMSKKVAFSFFLFYVFGVSFLFVLGPRAVASQQQSGPDVLEQAEKIINDLAGFIRGISTAAALVGVGTGAFLKKFSLGKPDRIETGNKMITTSIWAWVMINGLIIILRFFAGYFNVGVDDDLGTSHGN